MSAIADGGEETSPVAVLDKVLALRADRPMYVFCLEVIGLSEKSLMVEFLQENAELLLVGVCADRDQCL